MADLDLDKRCMWCDRAECPTLAPADEAVTRAFARSHVGPGETWLHPDAVRRGRCSEEDRQIMNAEYTARIARAQDCRRHAVDWRPRCLAAEARAGKAEADLAAARAEVARVRAVAMEAIDLFVESTNALAEVHGAEEMAPDYHEVERLRAAIATPVSDP